MFIAPVLIGSVLGYAAAGVALLFGLPLSMAFLVLMGVGFLATLTTIGIALLQNGDLSQDQLAVAV